MKNVNACVMYSVKIVFILPNLGIKPKLGKIYTQWYTHPLKQRPPEAGALQVLAVQVSARASLK